MLTSLSKCALRDAASVEQDLCPSWLEARLRHVRRARRRVDVRTCQTSRASHATRWRAARDMRRDRMQQLLLFDRHLDCERRLHEHVHDGAGWYFDFTTLGGQHGTGSSGDRTNRGAGAAAGDPTDDRAQSGAKAAFLHIVTLLVLRFHQHRCGLYLNRFAADHETIERDAKRRLTLDAS